MKNKFAMRGEVIVLIIDWHLYVRLFKKSGNKNLHETEII